MLTTDNSDNDVDVVAWKYFFFFVLLYFYFLVLSSNMARPGKTKESSKEKKLRRKEFAETQKQVKTIVVPGLIAIAIFIMAYVYIKTRPRDGFID
ncbi:unnamed protein product [Phyllotreta striolata]|uniref:Single-pass membrane and coiled-coil domain-containing protein 4 homolog n=1 Tax=Phyllotreta striolata TaxID=444603 RepID=A0A9N9XV42_PHYSR|nr:unnamed protein product [Phyllotreta striolata]